MINLDLKKIRRVLSYLVTSTMAVILWNVWVKEHPSVHVSPEKLTLESTSSADRTFVPDTFSPKTSEKNASQEKNKSDDTSFHSDFVLVKTDVLNLTISLLNGDVISAELPLYPISVNSTTPISILNNEKSKVYYASFNN